MFDGIREAVRDAWYRVTGSPFRQSVSQRDHGSPDGEEIVFTTLDPVASPADVSRQGDAVPGSRPGEESCVCPVTRQSLRRGQKIYQCRQCKIAYSPEGWEFLRKMERGRCCGCKGKDTVFPFVAS
jgi:hypothetical protein